MSEILLLPTRPEKGQMLITPEKWRPDVAPKNAGDGGLHEVRLPGDRRLVSGPHLLPFVLTALARLLQLLFVHRLTHGSVGNREFWKVDSWLKAEGWTFGTSRQATCPKTGRCGSSCSMGGWASVGTVMLRVASVSGQARQPLLWPDLGVNGTALWLHVHHSGEGQYE